jgi:hypothetical protein
MDVTDSFPAWFSSPYRRAFSSKPSSPYPSLLCEHKGIFALNQDVVLTLKTSGRQHAGWYQVEFCDKEGNICDYESWITNNEDTMSGIYSKSAPLSAVQTVRKKAVSRSFHQVVTPVSMRPRFQMKTAHKVSKLFIKQYYCALLNLNISIAVEGEYCVQLTVMHARDVEMNTMDALV